MSKNLTLQEIESLEEKYRDEFEDLVKNFFNERPQLDYIWLHSQSMFGNQSMVLNRKNCRQLINTARLKK